MKTPLSRAVALLILAIFGLTSCSAEYRERKRHRRHDDRVIIHERVIYRN